MAKRIVVDYDGTLFDKGIYPIEVVFNFLKIAQSKHEIVVVTSRTDKKKAQTEGPVGRMGLRVESFFYVGTGVDSPEGKARVVSTLKNVVLAIDNNHEVLAEYRALGIDAVHPEELDTIS